MTTDAASPGADHDEHADEPKVLAATADSWENAPLPIAFPEVRLRLQRLPREDGLEKKRPAFSPMRRSYCIVALSGAASEGGIVEPELYRLELFLGEVRAWRFSDPACVEELWAPPPHASITDAGQWLTEAALCLSVGEAADFESVETVSSGGLSGRWTLRLLRTDPAMDLLGDGGLMMRFLEPGHGGPKPRDLAKVSVDWRVWFLRNGELVLDWTRCQSFVLDEATVMVALDLAVREMDAGCRAVLRVSEEWGSGPLTPAGMKGACLRGAAVWVEFRVHEVWNEPGPGEHESVDDALAFALAKKQQGNACFAHKNSADDHRALRRYTSGIEVLEAALGKPLQSKAAGSLGPLVSEAQRPAVQDALTLLQLNAAQAQLRRSKWKEATQLCDVVLQQGPNVKASFRRGIARTEIGDLLGAVEDLRVAAEASPADAGIRKELARVDALHKAHRAEERSSFGGVFEKMRKQEDREEERQKAQAQKDKLEAKARAQAEAEKQRLRAVEQQAEVSHVDSSSNLDGVDMNAKAAAEAEKRAAAEANAKAEIEAAARARADAEAKAKAAALAREVADMGGDGQAACSLKAQELVEQLKASGKIPSTMQQVTTVEKPPSVEYTVPSFLSGAKKRGKKIASQ